MHAASPAMTPPAANTPPAVLRDDLALLPRELAQGHSALAIFRACRGLCWVQALGPLGLPGGDSDFLVAPRPVVELWVSELGDGPLATARPGRSFATAFDALESTALSWVLPREQAPLQALLAVLRAAWAPRRPGIPKVGPGIETIGQPCIAAWSSALSLADLEHALRRAVA
jgi:hypothetical protein